MLLTDELLLNYKRCQRRAFLNLYGNPWERDPEKDFLVKLRQENKKHQNNVLNRLGQIYHQPLSAHRDYLSRAKETEALMAEGIDYIYDGFLLKNGSLQLLASPSLLVKQPGKSKFGDWLYYPVNINLGRRPKPEYKLVIAFQAEMLAYIQGILPPKAQMILREQDSYFVSLEQWIPRMQEVLRECLQMLSIPSEPEVFISRQRCSLCHWYSHCYAIAQEQKHLSLIPGVTPHRYEHLLAMGLETVAKIADACPINLGEVIGMEVASQLKQQAQSLVENRPIIKPLKTLPKIPTASVEFYFDIEAEPDLNVDYLLGVLLIDYSSNTETFYAFLAEKPEEEGFIWQKFLELAQSYPKAPIFHFSAYEVETMKRLGKLYQTPSHQIKALLSRFVDLHQRVVSSVTLPVESYSLKSLANWLGFQWRDQGASGDQSVCWYDNWLKSGDRQLLEAILRYNEDDCRATFYLKEWLVSLFI